MPQQARTGLIVFQKQMAAASEIHSTDANGNNERVLVGPSQTPSQPSLAPSGTWITFTTESGIPIHREIWRKDTNGLNAEALTSDKLFDKTVGDPNYPDANASSISPNEKLVAVFSGKEQLLPGTDPRNWGYRNIAMVPATGGPRVLVTGCVPVNVGRGPCVAADNPFWIGDGLIGYDRDDGRTWASALPTAAGIAMPTQILSTSRGPVRVVVKP